MANRVGVIVGNFALTSGNNAERMNELMNWSGMCLYIRKGHTMTMYIELIKLCMWINWRWQAATRTESAVCKCLVVIVRRNKKTREHHHRQDEQNEERIAVLGGSGPSSSPVSWGGAGGGVDEEVMWSDDDDGVVARALGALQWRQQAV